MPTPVLVGIAQHSEQLGDPGYEGLVPVAMAQRAATLALADAGVPADRVDVLACTRQFDASVPGFPTVLGGPDNFPRALAHRLGADPARCIYAVAGGQSPQQLVTELAGAVADGSARIAMVVAAEAISTVLALAARPDRPDLTETTGATDEDRGVGLTGILASAQVAHQLTDAPTQYALFENARRARLGMSRADQMADIGRWFAPFTAVAAANPHAVVRDRASTGDLTGVTESNRLIVDPYPKAVVAREKVNQSAAVVITSDEVAAELGIPRSQWVYLTGHSDLRDRELLRRPELSRSAPAIAAVNAALAMAGLDLDAVTAFDLYSCFPIAVSIVAEELGLAPDDPRGLTLTGGLPFFGGPGNGYSLHAIVEAADRCRRDPGARVLVGANGGMLSKYSVGIYSSQAAPWQRGHDAALQAELDAVPDVPVALAPSGPATIETWTVNFEGVAPRAVIIGRTATGARFVANDFTEDDEVRALVLGENGPGAAVFVRALPEGNRVTLTQQRMDALAPLPAPGLRTRYDFVQVAVLDGVLEVTVTGSDGRQPLPDAAHFELASVFDAFEADPVLRVAILSGAAGLWSDPVTLPAFELAHVFPPSGKAGLTARALTKPVIAAVTGDVLGTAFEAVLACHLVVAEEQALLGLPQPRSGIIAADGGLVRLPARVPAAVANRMVLTGQPIRAADAERWGLVNEVVATGEALGAARRLAADILVCSPAAISRTLALMADLAGSGHLAADALDALLVTGDAAEAYAAATAGRAPRWSGT
ncbi:MAG: acetyl-CoA acetyltransferase [Marmoricola sp.]|nr:acetyl-CoA acetyltransferase [Marmoricola sp.]